MRRAARNSVRSGCWSKASSRTSTKSADIRAALSMLAKARRRDCWVTVTQIMTATSQAGDRMFVRRSKGASNQTTPSLLGQNGSCPRRIPVGYNQLGNQNDSDGFNHQHEWPTDRCQIVPEVKFAISRGVDQAGLGVEPARRCLLEASNLICHPPRSTAPAQIESTTNAFTEPKWECGADARPFWGGSSKLIRRRSHRERRSA